MKNRSKWIFLIMGVILGIVFAKTFLLQSHDNEAPHKISKKQKSIEYWTCSMHPQIKLPEEGKCPICAMDLIPAYEEGQEEGSEVSLKLSNSARVLAEIETFSVRFEEVKKEIRLVGKVDYDETRLAYISAWVPGRIERLFVDFTGTKVRKGDHLIKLYSPDLYSAQAEYIGVLKNWEQVKNSDLDLSKENAKMMLKSVKEKLRLYGLSEDQVKKISEQMKPMEQVIIYSPIEGTVIHKNGFEGMYVKTGDKIYTIADLKRAWVFLDVYEKDIQWIHYGQNIEIETMSFPGKIFKGKVAFIEPFMNEKTRTIKVRVNVDNPEEKLKPGMFARAVLHATIGEGGKIYEKDMAGKWICPMHPDVIEDKQTPCRICGMDLIKTEEYGFSKKPLKKTKVLVIPKSAPLITGKRAVVYVEKDKKDSDSNLYVGKEIVLGSRVGDYYIVVSGLDIGEKVVMRGNFKIDSALQIQGKPSMMNPAGFYSEKDNSFENTDSKAPFDAGILKNAMPHYFHAAHALFKGDEKEAANGFQMLSHSLEKVIKEKVFLNSDSEEAKKIVEIYNLLKKDSKNLDALRLQLKDVSTILKEVFDNSDYRVKSKLYLIFCPMAFDGKEAYWLSNEQEIKNPYYGDAMPSCGEIKNEYGIEIQPAPEASTHQHH
ncbi:MAG: efflux RND transporter periplasmic adaptor subunit [Candidatus Aureabacteria bacterium]|nr:efflux RND transporter periplasmic adaptor subunit [Candidatus Auribacterota bacterium]